QQAVEPVDLPVQLLLQRDHPRSDGVPLGLRLRQPLAGRHRLSRHRRWTYCRQSLRQSIQLPRQLQRIVRWQRELLQLGSSELVSVRPALSTNPCTLVPNRVATFGVADLLQPEARGRAV